MITSTTLPLPRSFALGAALALCAVPTVASAAPNCPENEGDTIPDVESSHTSLAEIAEELCVTAESPLLDPPAETCESESPEPVESWCPMIQWLLDWFDEEAPPPGATCASPTGATAWWSFDTYESAQDLGPYGLDGTFHGGAHSIAGLVGGAVQLENSGYVQIPHSSVISGKSWNLSFDTWIATAQDQGVVVIADKRKPSWPYTGYHAFIYNGYLALQLGNSGGYSNYISNVFVADGQLHHIAVTVDRDHAQGIRWYLDGVEAGTPKNPTGRTGSLYNTEPLRLGARSGTPSGYLNGLLDEFQLYRKVLSSTDVAALYAAGSFGRCDRP